MKATITIHAQDLKGVRKLLGDLVNGTIDIACLATPEAAVFVDRDGICKDDLEIVISEPNASLSLPSDELG